MSGPPTATPPVPPTPNRRPLLAALADFAAGVPVFRPGTDTPGSNAPYLAAPPPACARASRVPSRLRESLRASTAEGVFAEIVGAAAGGAVLTGWALWLGAGPFVVGVLGALPFFAQLVHLPAAWLTSRVGRRRLALWSVAASRLAYLLLVPLPYLPAPPQVRQAVLLAIAALSSVLAVVGNNAWVAWMGDLVPGKLRGRYFGRRTAICTLGGSLSSVAAGMLLDRGKAAGLTGTALATLALLAAVAGAVTVWLMSRQHDPGGDARTPADLGSAFEPLRDPRGRAVLGYLLAWNAAVGLAAPLFSIHMIENLKMGFTLIALQGAGVAAVRVLAVPLWGKAIDRLGARPVLVACSFGIAIIPLIWLLPKEGFLWPVALDSVASGILWSGQALASFALPLAVAPRAGRPFYLAIFSASGGLAFAAAATAGGSLAEALPRSFSVGGHTGFGLHVLFALSSLARVGAAVMAVRIIEPKAQPVGALFRLLWRRPEARADLAPHP